jgi:hypothetical protein
MARTIVDDGTASCQFSMVSDRWLAIGGRRKKQRRDEARIRQSGFVDDAVDFDLRAPETEADIAAGGVGAQIEPPPLVQAHAAAQTAGRSGFVFAMGPETRQFPGEFTVVVHWIGFRFGDYWQGH